MTRAALAAACAALAALLLIPAGAGASASSRPPSVADPGGRHFTPIRGEMATTRCVAWKTHRKRVVRWVKRGGERKRVVRVKRWRSCAKRAATAPVPAAPVVPVVPPAPAPTTPPPPEPEDPTIPRLGVRAFEWAYTLSRPQVPAGELVVELNNTGEDPHNLNLEREGGGPQGRIETIGPAQQGKAKLTLSVGSYRLWCDLDGHEAAGMKATLIVLD